MNPYRDAMPLAGLIGRARLSEQAGPTFPLKNGMEHPEVFASLQVQDISQCRTVEKLHPRPPPGVVRQRATRDSAGDHRALRDLFELLGL